MTTKQTHTVEKDYNPFHHLHDLDYLLEDGDGLARLALIELIDKLDVEQGPYLTALESASFSARLNLAVYARFVAEDKRMDESTSGDLVIDVVAEIARSLRRNVSTAADISINNDVYNLSLADQQRVLDAVAAISKADAKKMWDGIVGFGDYDKALRLARKPADAVSEVFSIKGFGDEVKIHQGGQGPYPIRKRAISKETGKFYMTWEACDEWGLSIPKHPHLPDNASVAVNIDFPKAPDGVILHVQSSTDDVPDGEGGFKSEQINIRIRKGDSLMQLSLLNKNLKYHSWTFTIEEVQTNDS